MKYPIAEKFKAPQGEGLYTGTPMAFIRFVGCSVGKETCTHCDTDFEVMNKDPRIGGGLFTPQELLEWVGDYRHICLTGGEPLDRNLFEIFQACYHKEIHIETSGTVEWTTPFIERRGGEPHFSKVWLCVSPKPGFKQSMINRADEVKVIIGGLGDGPGWPTINDARRWADEGKLVYIQPRNNKLTTDTMKMAEAVELVMKYPELRLSAQFHKYLRTR